MTDGVTFGAPIGNELAWTFYAPNSEKCAFANCKGVPDWIIVQITADCNLPHEIRINVACDVHKQLIEDEVI